MFQSNLDLDADDEYTTDRRAKYNNIEVEVLFNPLCHDFFLHFFISLLHKIGRKKIKDSLIVVLWHPMLARIKCYFSSRKYIKEQFSECCCV